MNPANIKLSFKFSETENSESDSDEEYVFPDLSGGGISNTSSLKDIEARRKMPKIQQAMMRIAGWHEQWLHDPNNEIEDLENEKQGLEDENLELKEEIVELEQKFEEYRSRTKNSLQREENLRQERDELITENQYLTKQLKETQRKGHLGKKSKKSRNPPVHIEFMGEMENSNKKNTFKSNRKTYESNDRMQCPYFEEYGDCKFGKDCWYSHDNYPDIFYKTKLCRYAKNCYFGELCRYAHNSKELRRFT